MSIQEIKITFKENAIAEAEALQADLQLARIAQDIYDGKPLDNYRPQLAKLVGYLQEILSTDLPAMNIDPQDALLNAALDTNLSKLFRERGVMRLYLLVNHRTGGVPSYMTLADPNTGEIFTKQEDLLSWFCREAHVSRAHVFGRFDLIRRMIDLDIALETAYHYLLIGPTPVRNALDIGNWDDHRLTSISPAVAMQVAKNLGLDDNHIQKLQDLADDSSENPQPLVDAFKPILAELLDRATNYESATDANDFIQHDIMQKPEVSYRWDPETNTLLVDYTRKALDASGVEYLIGIVTYRMAFDGEVEIPPEVVQDLLERLPIRNRRYIDN